MANCYCGIKKSIKIYSNTSIDRKLNLLAMLVEEKWISKKRSGKLLLLNKNNIRTCSKTLMNRKLTSYDVRTKIWVSKKRSGILLF